MKKNNILITGGTGSIGQELARQLRDHNIFIFSRNEKEQIRMGWEFPEFNYIIGDIRDEHAVREAVAGMHYVFHIAALKHVNICEEQPQEAIKTNILGTMNVINSCLNWGAQMINMSSDKAINPGNVYGRTKALAEVMVTEAGFVNIRSGNVLWSSGSVFPIWKDQLQKGASIGLTSDEMTRFFIHPKELVAFIIDQKDKMGTFTVPMKSFRLIDIANEFLKRYGKEDSAITITGLRPGERLHEYRDETTSSEHDICTDLNYIFQ